MKQNAIKKIPVTIIGIINSTKNSNIAITFNFRIKKTGDLHRRPEVKDVNLTKPICLNK